MKKFFVVCSFLLFGLSFSTSALANITPPPPPGPTDVEQCKNDGWRSFGDMFKNQGDCVSFVVTNGNNEPDGPPIH